MQKGGRITNSRSFTTAQFRGGENDVRESACLEVPGRGKLNPCKATPGGDLPAGYSRNYAGLPIAPPVVVKFDDATMGHVAAEIERLKKCVVIGKFIGELPQPKPFICG